MLEIFILKLVVAVTVVIGLSIITERVSPKLAGILSGYPTGSAISLFFFGLEVGPTFASQSAIYNMIGLVAMQAFIFFYYLLSKRFGIILSSIGSIIGYFVVIYLLHFIEPSRTLAVLIPVASIFVFLLLVKPIQNIKVRERVKLNHKVLFIRALFAASIILLITGIAGAVGPTWSGLFSAFPTTLFPLMLIVHLTYQKEHVHTIIKNVPVGIFSLVLYSFTISLTYPSLGIYWGTIVSFGVATIYLIAYQIVKNIRAKPTRSLH